MFAVIFEVNPKPEQWDAYLGYAKLLRPELEQIDGFIDNERFSSLRREGWLLSLSIWRDEKAVIRWRTLAAHHAVQEKGRFEIFENYHLRVGEIARDTGLPAGQSLQQQRFDETEVGAAKHVTISELPPADGGRPGRDDLARALGVPGADIDTGTGTGTAWIVDQEVWESLYNPGKLLLLVSWRDAAAAERWHPADIAAAKPRHRHVRIIRDYGMADRREAPQFYPPVTLPSR